MKDKNRSKKHSCRERNITFDCVYCKDDNQCNKLNDKVYYRTDCLGNWHGKTREIDFSVNTCICHKNIGVAGRVYKYSEILGNQTIAEDREECSFIWDNYYYEDESINEYELSLFIKEKDTDLYRKYQETHFQKAYDLDTVKKIVEKSGLEYMTAYDAFTKSEPHEHSERIYVVAREKGKKHE